MAWDNGREARVCCDPWDMHRVMIRVRDTLRRQTRRLIPADADAVAAAAAPATLHQAFSRARTVVDGQPLGLPR